MHFYCSSSHLVSASEHQRRSPFVGELLAPLARVHAGDDDEATSVEQHRTRLCPDQPEVPQSLLMILPREVLVLHRPGWVHPSPHQHRLQRRELQDGGTLGAERGC